ncbi:MAG: hypothetical protein JWL89_594 [Candidatus Saccharibacteria bacterium]|nr:hypothetical protein [Candidatus Saccharibacteria bacterium]
MADLLHIGTIELVSLPDDGIQAVPAKIDTGADNSAIWASNIHLEDGVLSFNLFAPGSMFYQEEPVRSTAFRTTTVKNSFGHKEFRYKIRLRIKVGKYILTRWFTLADRSRNNYPILLGKNFLKNKFIVDVSRKHVVSHQTVAPRVLVFTDYKTETDAFLAQAAKTNTMPITYECARYDELEFLIDGPATHVTSSVTGDDLASYSFTYFKNHHNRELSSSAAEYLRYKGRPFADQEFNEYMSASKLSEYMRLSCYGLSVPVTFCASTPILRNRYKEITERIGLPFVLKEIRSDKGKFNYLITTKKEFDTILDEAPETQVYCAQKYIPNDGFYRMYVMGKEVTLAIWRSATPHKDKLKSHLNKPRGSANAVNVLLDEVPGEAQDLALRSASRMNRQVAGVDIVQDKNTGAWYVLEANNDPQLRTGSFIDAKAEMVAKYFERELNQ